MYHNRNSQRAAFLLPTFLQQGYLCCVASYVLCLFAVVRGKNNCLRRSIRDQYFPVARDNNRLYLT